MFVALIAVVFLYGAMYFKSDELTVKIEKKQIPVIGD